MKRKIALIITLAALSGLAVYENTTTLAQTPATPPAATTPHAERHREIADAIRALFQAKQALTSAQHDFGGHRADALKACDEAVKQLKLCLQNDED